MTHAITDLRPGDLGFGPISGGAGLLVSAGQLMLGEGFRVGALDIRHVFVVTTPWQFPNTGMDDRYPAGPGSLIEAEPGGAKISPLTGSRWTTAYAYARLPEDYPGQAGDAAAIARAMIGTPYSFASYAALAAWRFGIKTPKLERWIDRRKAPEPINWPSGRQDVTTGHLGIALPREAICSVLADQAWSLTGKKIMEGVAHQCVTPGALAGRLLTIDGVEWMWPGR